MLVTAFAIIRIRNLFSVVILTGLFSLLSATIYVLMDAVDVAFTEAAVGAGVSTVLMLGTLALTTNKEIINSKNRNVPAVILTIVTGSVLIYGTLDMPSYGDANAPVHLHVVPRYLNESAYEVGIPNVVTSVLATYRGYDTLGEAFVVFTAALGVLAIIGRGRRKRKKSDIELESKA
jgi:multicomponent Na+:H+ antiporter subunit B